MNFVFATAYCFGVSNRACKNFETIDFWASPWFSIPIWHLPSQVCSCGRWRLWRASDLPYASQLSVLHGRGTSRACMHGWYRHLMVKIPPNRGRALNPDEKATPSRYAAIVHTIMGFCWQVPSQVLLKRKAADGNSKKQVWRLNTNYSCLVLFNCLRDPMELHFCMNC
jgi:hypothetical protein